RIGNAVRDDPHPEPFGRPLQRIQRGAETVSSHIYVAVNVLEISLSLKKRLASSDRLRHLVHGEFHKPEEFRSDRALPRPGTGPEARDEHGILVAMGQHRRQIRNIGLVLKPRAAWQEVDYRLAGNVPVKFKELAYGRS